MTAEEKRATVQLVCVLGAYLGYVAIVLVRAGGGPVTAVDYVAPLIGSILVSIVVSIVVNIVINAVSSTTRDRKDARDRTIDRFGEHSGRWGLIAGATLALILAMLRVDPFWIANALYLGFALAGVTAGLAKLVAYRRGLRTW
jgi:predicted membrane channel-forming protein YqfA (hemolysin III family)